MLRKDGKYVIYKAQWRFIPAGDRSMSKWYFINFDTIGTHLSRKTMYSEPWRSFSACGECWQKTGEHGCFDIKTANLLLKKLREIQARLQRPDREFRLVKVTISQHTEILFNTSG